MRVPLLRATTEYRHFYSKYLHGNFPCLFDEELTSSWTARNKWLSKDGVDINELLEEYKGQTLCVADCSKIEFGAHPIFEIKTADYLTYWLSRDATADKPRSLYLKDWHYFRQHSAKSLFSTPVFFSSDWLNEFSYFRSDTDDDFKFVYCGPKGTWTPLHSDVYCSYSWSANMIGVKRWWIFPPGEEKKLVNGSGNLPPDIRDHKLADPDDLDSDFPRCYIFDQLQGQTFFVPSGWYHQVLNTTDCISINHNWINACNIGLVWSHLQKQLQEVKKALSDVESTPGWEEACQECLKAWEGWNYAEFFLLLKYIFLSRWSRSTAESMRQNLPSTAITSNAGGRTPFRILAYQVDTKFSNVAKVDSGLIDRLRKGGESESNDSGLLSLNASSPDPFLTENDSFPLDWIRTYDLMKSASTINSLLNDADFQRLGLHQSGPLAWLWRETGLLK